MCISRIDGAIVRDARRRARDQTENASTRRSNIHFCFVGREQRGGIRGTWVRNAGGSSGSSGRGSLSTDRQTIGARRASAEATSVARARIGGKERVLWRAPPRPLSAVDVASAIADASFSSLGLESRLTHPLRGADERASGVDMFRQTHLVASGAQTWIRQVRTDPPVEPEPLPALSTRHPRSARRVAGFGSRHEAVGTRADALTEPTRRPLPTLRRWSPPAATDLRTPPPSRCTSSTTRTRVSSRCAPGARSDPTPKDSRAM